MTSPVATVEVFTLTQPRQTPYLGALRPGEAVNPNGYIVRQRNRTVYPTFDRSVLVRLTTQAGTVGWGETYGIVAPGAVAAIINDLLAGFVIGRVATDPAAIYDDLYDLMRVRGYTGGFYVDALAALDIALWDIAGHEAGRSVRDLLGGGTDRIPAYVSGLPEKTMAARADLARHWQDRGFSAFKFATPVADDGPAAEMDSLRGALGPAAKIAADMHWNQTADEALALIAAMAPFDPWFAEAPVYTEDIAGLEAVTHRTDIPIAVGEEWRTPWDMRMRIDRCRIAIVQPEMGHKGITNVTRIGALAADKGIDVIPHATVGAGIFLAASLQAASTLPTLKGHEFQHSIFEPNRQLLQGNMDCREGQYHLPDGPGLGVAPSDEALRRLQPI
ncbi:mandelate racemase/muconate lactonizing enzyme family protein [Falsirhodobacter deserti]|uniref:mandelate racemase/muconate lactonizing enzyme family protein n=1 Tax=Falsirhodobacter deserti TaxID=1365611 RepID=UPI000FE433CF|nr:mandelate racemase/muconate lactonizing enzyme family protein [Falsirhodobacter deserti]